MLQFEFHKNLIKTKMFLLLQNIKIIFWAHQNYLSFKQNILAEEMIYSFNLKVPKNMNSNILNIATSLIVVIMMIEISVNYFNSAKAKFGLF